MSNAARIALAAIVALSVTNILLIASQWPTPRLRDPDAKGEQYRRNDHGEAADAGVADHPSQPNQEKPDREHGPRDERWLAWLISRGLLTAFVGGCSAVIAFVLLRHRSVTRPWIVLSVTDCNNVMHSLQTAERPFQMRFFAECAVTNHGSVPGWLIEGYSKLTVVRHPLERAEPRSRRAIRQLMRRTPLYPVAPGRESRHAFHERHELTEEEWAALQGRSASVMFFAFFRYKGVRRRLVLPYPVAWFAWEWKVGERPPDAESEAVWTGPAMPKHWTRYT